MARPGGNGQEARIEGYLDCARGTYGSLEDPDFRFASGAAVQHSHPELVAALSRLVKVTDMSDENDNVCFALELTERRSEWKLLLSMVGPYAMLLRVVRGWPRRFRLLKVEVVEQPETGTEQAITDLVRGAGFTMVSAQDAEWSVPFSAEPDTEPVDGPLFRVLFSTIPDGVEDLPWRYRG